MPRMGAACFAIHVLHFDGECYRLIEWVIMPKCGSTPRRSGRIASSEAVGFPASRGQFDLSGPVELL